jgi:hypothetical protein
MELCPTESYGIVGKSPEIRNLIGAITRLAPFVRTVLISGETGTGKELVAQAFHIAGSRGDRPFFTIDCTAIPVTVFERDVLGETDDVCEECPCLLYRLNAAELSSFDMWSNSSCCRRLNVCCSGNRTSGSPSPWRLTTLSSMASRRGSSRRRCAW